MLSQAQRRAQARNVDRLEKRVEILNQLIDRTAELLGLDEEGAIRAIATSNIAVAHAIMAAQSEATLVALSGYPTDNATATVIDSDHLEHQREFSAKTFGPGARTADVIDHICKALDEIAAAPDDVTEWADLIILAFDGAMRAGHGPQSILDAVHDKQAVNEARTWPDWRSQDPDKAIEHVDPDGCEEFGTHRWQFDGDDPYVVCQCGQRRDALSGRIVGGDR